MERPEAASSSETPDDPGRLTHEQRLAQVKSSPAWKSLEARYGASDPNIPPGFNEGMDVRGATENMAALQRTGESFGVLSARMKGANLPPADRDTLMRQQHGLIAVREILEGQRRKQYLDQVDKVWGAKVEEIKGKNHQKSLDQIQKGEKGFSQEDETVLSGIITKLTTTDADYLAAETEAKERGDKRQPDAYRALERTGPEGERLRVWTYNLYQDLDYLNDLIGVTANPEQKNFLMTLRDDLQSAVGTDFLNESIYLEHRIKVDGSILGQFKPLVKGLGAAAFAALGTVNGVIDFNNKTLSPSTVLYFGLATLLGSKNALSPAHKKEVEKLEFLRQPSFEALTMTYGIAGNEWAEMARRFMADEGSTVDTARDVAKGTLSAKDFIEKELDKGKGSAEFRANLERLLENKADLGTFISLMGKADTPLSQERVFDYVDAGAGPEQLRHLKPRVLSQPETARA